MPERFLFVIATRPVEGRAAEFEQYYEEQHIADLLAVPGIMSASRYRVLTGHADWLGASLGIYEVEAEDAGSVMAEMASRYGTDRMPRSGAVDSSRTIVLTASEIMPLRRAADVASDRSSPG